VWRAVKSLSPLLREAIVLRHWGDYTYQEIGDIVGCPMKTAQSRVRLAYQRLEKELAEIERQDLVEERI
jgi:DNA-directed RNA polymerase specialized sigma24 family protein